MADGLRSQTTGEAEPQTVESALQVFPIACGTAPRPGIDQGQNTSLLEGLHTRSVDAFRRDRDPSNHSRAKDIQLVVRFRSVQLDPVQVQSGPDLEDLIWRTIDEYTDGFRSGQSSNPSDVRGVQRPGSTLYKDESQKVGAGLNGRFCVEA